MKAIAAVLMGAAVLAAAPPTNFTGDWELVSAAGTTPPPAWTLAMRQSTQELHFAAHWSEPKNGQYGLTLTGLLVPEARFSLDGRADLNQAGPFVVHSRTKWDGARLVTAWTTSEFQGISFHGRWIRWLSADGRALTLEIQADSSDGRRSGAVLRFRKK